MEDLVPAEIDILVVLSRLLIRVCVIDVEDLSFLVPVDFHVLREQRIEAKDAVLSIPDDLCVTVSPQEQMRHHDFPEGETRHLRIRLPVQQLIQRMICGSFLCASAVH